MKSKIGTVEGKMKAIHSHNLNYRVWGLPHPPPPNLHLLNLMEFTLSLSLNILLNTVLKVALTLIFSIKNMTHAMQIAKAAPSCSRGLEYRLGPGGWLPGARVILLHFLSLENIHTFVCKVEALWGKCWKQTNHPTPNHFHSWHLPCPWKNWEMFKSHQRRD